MADEPVAQIVPPFPHSTIDFFPHFGKMECMIRSDDQTKRSLDTYAVQQQRLERGVMAQQLSTRKAKKESQKMLFQTIGIVVVTIVLLVLFIFVLMPGAIRLAGSFGGLTTVTQSDTVPPRIPTYSAPPSATNESQITVTGFGEPNSSVVLVMNGQESTRETISESGEFSISIDLNDGENVFALYSVDEAENESNLGRQYTVVYDTEAPEFEWNEPEDGRTVTNLRERTIKVAGKIEDQNVKVYLNDRIVFVNSAGEFSESFQLSDGENTLKLKAVDEAGNETEAERVVTFRP